MPVAVRDSNGTLRRVERLVAYDDTEHSIAVAGNNTVLSIVSGISIPAGNLIRVTCDIRKSAGAAAAPLIGFRINATIVLSTVAALGFFSAANVASSGLLEFIFYVGEASYLQTGIIHSETADTAYGNPTLITSMGLAQTADIPIATITSLAILGNNVNNLVTLFTKNLKVYS